MECTVGDALGTSLFGGTAYTSPVNIVGGTLDNAISAGNYNGLDTVFNLTGGTMSCSGGGTFSMNGGNSGYGGTLGAINSLATNVVSTISGSIELWDGPITITTAPGQVPSGIDLNISAVIIDGIGLSGNAAGTSSGFTKAGLGVLALTATNTYSGNTANSAGVLQLGDGVSRNGSVAGNIDNQATLVFANPAAQTYAGVVSDVGSVVKTGAGTLTLSGANTYSGNTTINAGTLALSGSGSIADSPNITAATAAKFDVSAVTGGSYALNGSGTLTLNLNKSGSTLTQGQVVIGAKNLTYGGVLTVTASGDALASGDSFALVSKSSGALSGWFTGVTLPALASGLTWDTNDLATAGNLDIYNFTTNAVQTMVALKNTATTLQISKLTAKISGARGTVAVNSVSSSSGATVGISGGNITYTPPSGFTGTHTFNAVLSDGHGSITAIVVVTVSAANTGPSITPVNNGSGYGTFTASGIRGTTYIVQVSTDLLNWTDYATVTADSQDGLIQFTDTALISSYSPAVFYCLKQQ